MVTAGTPRRDPPLVIQGSGSGQGVLREQGPCQQLFGVSEARKPGLWVIRAASTGAGVGAGYLPAPSTHQVPLDTKPEL